MIDEVENNPEFWFQQDLAAVHTARSHMALFLEIIMVLMRHPILNTLDWIVLSILPNKKY